MQLTAFRVGNQAPKIRAALVSREWMDESPQRFAYRCLPLTVANSHGWEILCPFSFEVYWNGGRGLGDLRIVPLDDAASDVAEFATSHFGNAVLTFHTGYLFKTDPGYSLHVSGPVNRPKDGATALTGIVETDWLPQPFTMNWLFTAPGGPLVFEEGEPFCHIFPVRRDLLEQVEPEVRAIELDTELYHQYLQWTASRTSFNADLQVPGSAAQEEKWQKHYSRSRHPDGEQGTADHVSKIRLREFRMP